MASNRQGMASGSIPVGGIIAEMNAEHVINGTNQNGAEPSDVWRARRFIEQNSADAISLTRVAAEVRISPTHLSEKFKHVTGTKFVDYVARTRFNRACALLREGDLRVSEIAFAVGFQSLSQFNRVFRKLSGKSPREYRAAELSRREIN